MNWVIRGGAAEWGFLIVVLSCDSGHRVPTSSRFIRAHAWTFPAAHRGATSAFFSNGSASQGISVAGTASSFTCGDMEHVQVLTFSARSCCQAYLLEMDSEGSRESHHVQAGQALEHLWCPLSFSGWAQMPGRRSG